MQAYCFKCQSMKDLMEAEWVTLKNGRPATKGRCETCQGAVFVIGKGRLDDASKSAVSREGTGVQGA